MNILGISAFYHDSAACLVQDGDIVAAAQEERFTRRKHDYNFPKHAVDYCLKEGGLSAADMDLVGLLRQASVENSTVSWRRTLPMRREGSSCSSRVSRCG